MNCHKDNNKSNKKHNPLKHMLMMPICCGLPFLIVSILPFINIGAGFKAGLTAITPFICPIMMLVMFATMFKGMKNNSCCDDKREKTEDTNV